MWFHAGRTTLRHSHLKIGPSTLEMNAHSALRIVLMIAQAVLIRMRIGHTYCFTAFTRKLKTPGRRLPIHEPIDVRIGLVLFQSTVTAVLMPAHVACTIERNVS